MLSEYIVSDCVCVLMTYIPYGLRHIHVPHRIISIVYTSTDGLCVDRVTVNGAEVDNLPVILDYPSTANKFTSWTGNFNLPPPSLGRTFTVSSR
jgi:hypothetical protein